jgi:hypothetical protein
MPKGLMIAIGKMKPGSDEDKETDSGSSDPGLDSAFEELVSALGLDNVDTAEGVRALKNFVHMFTESGYKDEEDSEEEDSKF